MADMPITMVNDLFVVMPDEGKLIWRERPRSDFPNKATFSNWNRNKAGTEARCINPAGYVQITFQQKSYAGHRIIWSFVNGRLPDGQIDHINGDRSDNRICNLRDVGHVEQRRNAALCARNKSGRIGVCFFDGRWKATIGVNNRTVNLGKFLTFEGAVAAREAAEVRFGFHPNHGRAA